MRAGSGPDAAQLADEDLIGAARANATALEVAVREGNIGELVDLLGVHGPLMADLQRRLAMYGASGV